jgi:hypothetical protein
VRRLLLITSALLGCAPLPRTHDPEGCDHVAESAKRAGSDLVVDGDLYCASSDADCELTPARIITSAVPRPVSERPIPIHILRAEANAYSNHLRERGEISFCYPAALWFPSEGHYRGRFYLLRDSDRRYHVAFYPRVREN